MTSSPVKGFILSAVLTTCLAVPPAYAEEAAAPVTKEQVQQIIHDYLMDNPMVIMTSVDEYQKKTMRERSSTAIKSNFDVLYKDTDAPFIGNKDGDVTVVEFMDYNCGYCKKALPELQELVAADKNVKVVFKEFPILGPTSETSSKWALAAHKQGKYFEFHRRLMEHKGQITDEALESVAKDSGLDVAAAKVYIGGTDALIQIEKNRTLANQLGLTGTPSFVIGETAISAALSADDLKKMVADARAPKAPAPEEKK